MSLHFRYKPLTVPLPVLTLGGRTIRPRPIVPVTVIGPSDSCLLMGLLDTGADDTVFPESIAAIIGVDLTNAPSRSAQGVTRGAIPVRYAEVMLRLADQKERREWTAWVCFSPIMGPRALLGFAGFLQFFSALFLGDREEVELTVNGLYPGT
jgi:hypothetical protein